MFRVRTPTAFRTSASPKGRTGREEGLLAELRLRQQHYESGSYSFYSSLFVSRIASRAQAAHNTLRRYHLKQLLQGVVKRLLMNELELIFLDYMLEESGWDLRNDKLMRWESAVRQEPSQAEEIGDLAQYRRLLLLLFLSAFAIKYYLNGAEEAELAALATSPSVSGLPQIFEDWMTVDVSKVLVVEPQQLNTCFKSLVTKDGLSAQQMDYNRMVEQLLIISPSYKPNELDVPRPRLSEHVPGQRSKAELIIQIPQGRIQSADPGAARKKIRLNTSEPQQDVNSHLNCFLQNMDPPGADSERQLPAAISKHSSSRSKDNQGLFSIPEDYSELSMFRVRPGNQRKSELTSRLNLQRSSLYDYL